VRHARDIDAAAAGIALGRRAAHLLGRLDVPDIDEDVDGGIDRDGDDVRHRYSIHYRYRIHCDL
jgi:hypothetical protein